MQWPWGCSGYRDWSCGSKLELRPNPSPHRAVSQSCLCQPVKDLESPSSTRLEVPFPYHDSRAIAWLICAVLCLVTQSCLTLRNSMDCSLPGSSFRGIFQQEY